MQSPLHEQAFIKCQIKSDRARELRKQTVRHRKRGDECDRAKSKEDFLLSQFSGFFCVSLLKLFKLLLLKELKGA